MSKKTDMEKLELWNKINVLAEELNLIIGYNDYSISVAVDADTYDHGDMESTYSFILGYKAGINS